jgi:hypothetical protein
VGRSRTEAINAAGKGVVEALQDALQRAQVSHKLLSANHTRTVQNLTDALANIDRVQVGAFVAMDELFSSKGHSSYLLLLLLLLCRQCCCSPYLPCMMGLMMSRMICLIIL